MFVGNWFGRFGTGLRTALAVSVLLTGTALPVWADDASTNSNSNGGASAGGPGVSGAGVGTENSSNASSDKTGVSAGSEGTSNSGSANSGGTRSKTHTNAKAWAKGSRKKGLEAYAEAGAWTTATAVDDDGLATGQSGNFGKAYAKSSKKQTLAYATSSNGGFALAVTGRGQSTTTSSIPDGQTYTSNRGKLRYSVSYTDLGSYSLAVVRGRIAYAATGTTEDVGALTSQNITAIMRSSMFAEAYADPRTARATSYASAGSTASTATSSSSTYGYSYAFAQVSLGGKTIVKMSAMHCDGSLERRDARWEDCRWKRKYVNASLKKKSGSRAKTLQ